MRRSHAALAVLAVLTACSSSVRVPVTNQPVTNQPVTNQPVTNQPVTNQPARQGEHVHPGDVLLTSADDGRAVTITVGQTVAAVIPDATSVFIADSAPEPGGSPVPGDTTAVLSSLGGFRFRAVGAGQAMLAAEYNCGIGASCARHWHTTVNVRAP